MSYTASTTGRPCWYELHTTDPQAAGDFYGRVLGWSIQEIPQMDYRLAADADGHGTAGLATARDAAPGWIIYQEVGDVDAAVADAKNTGATAVAEPADIPGTGRYAILADPQGATIGLLQPQSMDEAPEVSAYDSQRVGHGQWQDLYTSDPAAALEFYRPLVGWTVSTSFPMGDMGDYNVIRAGETDLGGVTGLGGAGSPHWLPYFGVDSVDGAVERATAAGGALTHGPTQTPGGGWIAQLTDAQGVAFAVAGPR